MTQTTKKLTRDEFARKQYEMDMAINFTYGLMTLRKFQAAMRAPTPTEFLEEADLYVEGHLEAPDFMVNPDACPASERECLTIIANWRTMNHRHRPGK